MTIKRSLTLILLLFIQTMSFSQTKDSLTRDEVFARDLYHDPEHGYKFIPNKEWARFKQTKTYENQGDYHSEYLALNPDSTFEFIGYHEGPTLVSFGRWSKINSSIVELNWNSQLTNHIIQNTRQWKKYKIMAASPVFMRRVTPVRIRNLVLKIEGNHLNPHQLDSTKEKQFITFIDDQVKIFDKSTLIVHSDTTAKYDPGGNTVGYSVDSAFFNDQHTLVKFIMHSQIISGKEKGNTSRSIYYFLPDNYCKVYIESFDSNKILSSECYYFLDQKLIKAFCNARKCSPGGVHTNISSFRKLIVFDKKIMH